MVAGALTLLVAHWRPVVLAAAMTAAWLWHAGEVRTAAKAAEKATHAHYAAVLADISAKTAAAEKAIRKREQQAQTAMESEAKNGQERIDLARADADRARTAAAVLRQQLDTYRRAATRDAPHPGAAPAGPPAGDALDLLAHLFSRVDDRAGELAAFADLAHAAGSTCERAYDEVRGALSHAQTR